MYPETFSQFDEQQAILAHFGEKKDGRFLDIGAWDPICFSNTRALYMRGWSGVCIEPSPTPVLSLLKEYGAGHRVEIVQAAVTLEDGLLKGFMASDDSVSSADAAHLAKWKGHAKFLGKMTVRTITWPQINNWFGGFDFVNLDAEGISVDLFHAMLASGVKPSCVCVEHDDRMGELAAAATKVGYKLVYSNGTNAVFTI